MPTTQILGDPHLGRSFIHGVPLHRRGEREKFVWMEFKDSILGADADYHICLGDLFDKPIVPYGLILETALAYAQAALKNRQTTYVILKGNHDWLRDLEQPSAFDLFAQLVKGFPNIRVVTEWFEAVDDRMVFFAWHPTISATEMVERVHSDHDVAFGHWDTEFGELNMIPTKALAAAHIRRAITGHVHKPDQFARDGVDVTVHGSMQPYAHGEEINDDLYVTLKLDQVKGDLHNKCVRVLLGPDEILDVEVDCLQLTIKKEAAEADDEPSVQLGDFDMGLLFQQAFEKAKVPETIRDTLLDKFNEKRLVEGA